VAPQIGGKTQFRLQADIKFGGFIVFQALTLLTIGYLEKVLKRLELQAKNRKMIVVPYPTFPQHQAPEAKGNTDGGEGYPMQGTGKGLSNLRPCSFIKKRKDIPCMQRPKHGDLFWLTGMEPH